MAVVVLSLLLFIGLGVLLGLIRERPQNAGADQPPLMTTSVSALAHDQSVKESAKNYPVPVPIPDVDVNEGDVAVSESALQGGDTMSDSAFVAQDSSIKTASSSQQSSEFPRTTGELATVLASITDDVRSCAELNERYRPKTLSVHLIRSSSRARVSAIEPQPPPMVGTCLSRLIHKATSSVVVKQSWVVHVYDMGE